jgi:hypothetical protein
MRPVGSGEALPAGTRLTLFSEDKPDRFFRVIKFWMDETMGASLGLETGVPSYEVEDEEGTIHLLINLPIEEENEDRRCLWRPDQAGFHYRLFLMGHWSRTRKAIPVSAGLHMTNVYCDWPQARVDCCRPSPFSCFRQIFCHLGDKAWQLRVRHHHSTEAFDDLQIASTYGPIQRAITDSATFGGLKHGTCPRRAS